MNFREPPPVVKKDSIKVSRVGSRTNSPIRQIAGRKKSICPRFVMLEQVLIGAGKEELLEAIRHTFESVPQIETPIWRGFLSFLRVHSGHFRWHTFESVPAARSDAPTLIRSPITIRGSGGEFMRASPCSKHFFRQPPFLLHPEIRSLCQVQLP